MMYCTCCEVFNIILVLTTFVGGCVLFFYSLDPIIIEHPIFSKTGEFSLNENYDLDIFMIMYGTANSIMTCYSIHKFVRYLRKEDGPIPDGSLIRKQVVYGFTFQFVRVVLNIFMWVIWFKIIEKKNKDSVKFDKIAA